MLKSQFCKKWIENKAHLCGCKKYKECDVWWKTRATPSFRRLQQNICPLSGRWWRPCSEWHRWHHWNIQVNKMKNKKDRITSIDSARERETAHYRKSNEVKVGRAPNFTYKLQSWTGTGATWERKNDEENGKERYRQLLVGRRIQQRHGSPRCVLPAKANKTSQQADGIGKKSDQTWKYFHFPTPTRELTTWWSAKRTTSMEQSLPACPSKHVHKPLDLHWKGEREREREREYAIENEKES